MSDHWYMFVGIVAVIFGMGVGVSLCAIVVTLAFRCVAAIEDWAWRRSK